MLRKVLVVASLLLGAAMSYGAPAGVSTAGASAPTAVEPWWRCPSGYAFETSGSSVHCKKPSYTATKAFMPCTIPTPDLKIDLMGTTDMCAGSVGLTVTAEPLCYVTDISAGYTKRHVGGRDYCGKFVPAEIQSPNEMISR